KMNANFEGKTFIVTGAASGIGFAQAETFLNQGAVVLGMDINQGKMVNLKETFEKQFDITVGSVKNKSDVQLAVNKTVNQIRKVDILLNTAGVLNGYQKTLETDEALWDLVLNVNLKGMYYMTNTVLPHLLEQKLGRLVTMTSISVLID